MPICSECFKKTAPEEYRCKGEVGKGAAIRRCKRWVIWGNDKCSMHMKSKKEESS